MSSAMSMLVFLHMMLEPANFSRKTSAWSSAVCVLFYIFVIDLLSEANVHVLPALYQSCDTLWMLGDHQKLRRNKKAIVDQGLQL